MVNADTIGQISGQSAGFFRAAVTNPENIALEREAMNEKFRSLSPEKQKVILKKIILDGIAKQIGPFPILMGQVNQSVHC